MKISDAFVKLLKEYAAVPPVRKVHPEDASLYQNGLVDGMALLAKETLDQLKPDMVVPAELESE